MHTAASIARFIEKLNIIADSSASFFRKADGFFHLLYLAARDI